MSTLSPKFVSLIIAVIMIVSGIMAAALIVFASEDSQVEAKMSGADAAGYRWVDNKSPEPTIEYKWIDATKGEYLEGVKSYSSSADNNEKYKLPFQFEFYGDYYDEVMVHASGYIDFAPYYSYSYPYQTIPSSSYQNNWIAAYHGYGGAYPGNPGNFRVFALQGRTFGERWVCFQWDKLYAYYYYSTGNYGPLEDGEITFQLIIYESGLIKMQYLDTTASYSVYTGGNYAVAGIENAGGTTGRQYSSTYTANLGEGLAIMYGKNLMEVSSVELETDENGAFYAQYRDYMITTTVSHPAGNDNIRVVAATLGSDYGSLVMYYFSDGTYAFSTDDPEGYLTIDSKRSNVVVDGEDLIVTFYFSPTFAYPTTAKQNLKITAMGAGALPRGLTLEGSFWVEKYLDIYGALAAFSEERGFIQNGGWAHGNEEIQFRGARAVYPSTTKTPRAGAISFIVTDESGIETEQEYVERFCAVDIISAAQFSRKTYNLSIGNIPPASDISEGVTYYINIDPFRPLPPEDIKIRADSFNDNNIQYDDDNEVYVTWSPAEDLESGISGYYVTTHDPFEESPTMGGEITWIENPDTSTKIIFDSAGTRKVWVWSVDKAGNPSIPAFGITKVDGNEVMFSEFSPGHQVWINTHTPINSVLIDDGEGSGVSAKNVQYTWSTTNTNEYSAWTTVKVARDAPQVRASVMTSFENGKSNWIKYRATDVAGNGWTESQDYNVWVDEEDPLFINFRPYETEFQNGKYTVVSLDISDRHGQREGSGVKIDTIEFRYSIGGKGLYGDWKPVVITSQTDQSVHIEMEIEFEEGKENYIQFRTYDNVGNYATSKDFNVKVNSAPEIIATISDPMNGMQYITEERILFDASDSKDPDGDDLDFRWYSDINGFLSNSESFFRSLSAGVHVITLLANDPAHTEVVTFEMEVKERAQIDPESIDSDGDGMHDQWEIDYKLNPFRSDGFIDTDHDMFTNYQEYQNRTDPTIRTSHPSYEREPPRDVEKDKNTDEQYRVVTIGIILISLVIIIALILLAFSKRRNFQLEVDEEKDLEAEEIDYRDTLDRKRSERLNMET